MRFKNFGNEFRKVRAKLNLTQVEMGTMIRIHPQYISNCERGICLLPKRNLRLLLKKFNLCSKDKELMLLSIARDQLKATEKEWGKIFG